MGKTQKRRISDVALNLLLDIGLTVGVLVLLAQQATGQVIHEYVGVAFAAALVVHLLLHWDWMVGVAKRLFQKMSGQVRLKSIINLAIFIDMAIMIVSGLLISEVVLKPLGLQAGPFWKVLHVTSANLIIWLVALHVAMSWKWLVNAINQRVVQPVSRLTHRVLARRPIAAHS